MTTFVLVHGGWSGGWMWQRLRPLLRQAGHAVFTPTLTGVGERVHLASTAAARLPRTYIYCSAKPAGDPFKPFAEQTQRDPRWSYAELPTDHYPQLTMPRELAGILSRAGKRTLTEASASLQV